ncbi:MAG: AbrB/MazE/SpoVT family DNA-binding domain-containing protein [Candidatus Asgardarchaeia archaeon]
MSKKRITVKVTRKGQITIPIEFRRKYNIKDEVAIIDDDGKLLIIPVYDLEDLFGVDGENGLKIAKELLRDKQREIELEEKVRT